MWMKVTENGLRTTWCGLVRGVRRLMSLFLSFLSLSRIGGGRVSTPFPAAYVPYGHTAAVARRKENVINQKMTDFLLILHHNSFQSHSPFHSVGDVILSLST